MIHYDTTKYSPETMIKFRIYRLVNVYITMENINFIAG